MTKEQKIKNVLKFYVLCNTLKNVIRKGWLTWNVQRERIESVAEHIYGTQMLALAIYKEFDYDFNFEKVIYMLAVHEIEEIEIGDLAWYDISPMDKLEKGKKAVTSILGNIKNSDDVIALIDEFNERKTKEALFAHYCDKLECDIQVKLYDEENCVDLTKQEGNLALNNDRVKELVDQEKSWSNVWIEHDRQLYANDEVFTAIIDFLKNNNISS